MDFVRDNNHRIIQILYFSQLIEDLKQNIHEYNEKLHNKQNIIDQLNNELEKLKQQPQVCHKFSQKKNIFSSYSH